MSKVVRTVGTIVGVALVAVGFVTMNPALVSLGIKVAAISNVAASAIDIIAPPKIKFGGEGNPLRFTTNPQSGVPYAMGRTRMDGVRIHADTTDGFSGKTKNDIVAFAAELSGGGAIDSIQSFTADKEAVTFDGSGNAIGRLANYMAQKVHTGGAMATALSLSLGSAAFPGWTSAHELSGHTHALWMVRYETDGSKYGAGVPEPSWIGKWVKVYDPRLDSTYSGGSGTHRSNDETTWAWSRNPALHALTWCIGRYQNGKRTLGIGAPVANIRVADFVECANVCDTNHWWCGGVEWSTDSKWDVLKRILQAGGAVPTMTGAMIGCRVNTPRIPVTTISSAHILDELSIPATKPRRDRFNTVIPRYRSEDHEWEVISGTPIAVSTYVTEDGGTRIKEIDYPLVQHEVAQTNVDGNVQAGQLAAYDIVNSREAGPIEWTTGPAFIGLKTGDCVTLDIPEEGLSSQDVVITRVALDPSTGKISFTGETETAAKHAFALGQSTTPPPAFSLTAPDYLPPDPDAADWTLTATTGLDGTPYLHLVGALTATSFDSVLIQYKKTADASWTMWGAALAATSVTADITGLDGTSSYDVRIAYQGNAGQSANWTSLGPATTASSPILDALIYAASRGKMWTGATRPAVVDSEIGDTWLDPSDGTLYERVDATGISIGGSDITIGGSVVFLAWTWSANQAIRDAFATANSAYTSANDAIDQLIGLADDGVISVNEKITKLIPDQAQLAAKYTVLAGQAAAFSVSTTAAAAAKTTWDALLAAMSPAWNDTTADSAVTRTSFDAARDGFDVALADLDKAIKDKTATLAAWSGVSGAPSSTPAAIDSGTVAANAGVNSDGTIKTDKVTTGAIVDNSITIPTISFDATSGYVTGSYVEIHSDTYTSTGKPVVILFAATIHGADGGLTGEIYEGYLILKRGATTLATKRWSIIKGENDRVNSFYAETPGSGSQTYSIEIIQTSHTPGDDVDWTEADLYILETKK